MFKLIQGDCLEKMREMPDASVDVIITDPPYGIGINKMSFVTSGAVKAGVAKRNDFSQVSTDWDKNGLTTEYFNEIKRVSKNQVIFGANHFANILPVSSCWIVWDKRVNKKFNNDFADCELIWTSFNRPSRIIRYLWSGMMQNNMRHKEERIHPTQKPVKVMRELIEMFSKEGDTVLDPFMGSGTTGVACVSLNRNFIGIELDENYFKIAEKRITSQSQQERLFQ